jgi:hypothetical protein
MKYVVLTAVNILTVFWEVTPNNPIEIYQRFRGPGYNHLQGNITVAYAKRHYLH